MMPILSRRVSAVTKLLGKPEMSWVVSALIACGLLAGAILVPLWRMELVAPQYPKGLVMYAYGYKFEDDPKFVLRRRARD